MKTPASGTAANGATPAVSTRPAPPSLPQENYLMVVVTKGLGPDRVEERDLRSLEKKG